jgi:thiol-disulfide isomerase/thioredoxin
MSAARSLLHPLASGPRATRGNRTPRRTALFAAGAAAAALALAGCGSGGVSGGSGQTGFVTSAGGVATVKAASRQAGPKLSGETVDGKQLDVSSFKGKIVVLNVWGSWCPPCRAEAPNFAKVARETESKGVQFVGINTRDHSKGPAQAFEQDHGIPYPSLYDPTGKLILRFPKGTLNPQYIPSTVVLDRQGRVAARSLKAMTVDDLHKMLDPLIAEH